MPRSSVNAAMPMKATAAVASTAVSAAVGGKEKLRLPTRREFLATTVAALQAPPRRPNLLFILADTWRGQALPSADPNIVAPNLARLAREGVNFTRAYTSYPVCCPARAAVLTGKYPHAAGVSQNHMLLPLAENTMSAEFQRAGYRTGYIGKWHLDGSENPGFVPPARRRGFDFWAAYNVAHRHFGSVYFRDTPEPIPAPGFEADHLTSLALDFIRQKSAQPFFLYLSLVPPHAPFTPPPRHAVFDPAKIHLRPNVPASAEAAARKDAAGYYGLCSAVDENVGRVLDQLDRQRLADDTIVVFTSDHGHMLGSHGLDGIDFPYEEATRIPLLIRYPKRIKPARENEALVSNVDFAPTLLPLCGVPPPAGMQGRNLAGWLTRRSGARPDTIYCEGQLGTAGEWRMVVRAQDKLVVDGNGKVTHLYDLGSDPYEMHNRAADAGVVARHSDLAALLRRWMR